MEINATQKFVLTSPKKLREVVSLVKKLSPSEAVERLPFSGKRAAEPLVKVIKTALANAKQREISPDTLFFKEIQIGEGPRLKRFRAGSRGRAKPYKKRMSHIRVVLATKELKKPKTEIEKVDKKSIEKPKVKNKK